VTRNTESTVEKLECLLWSEVMQEKSAADEIKARGRERQPQRIAYYGLFAAARLGAQFAPVETNNIDLQSFLAQPRCRFGDRLSIPSRDLEHAGLAQSPRMHGSAQQIGRGAHSAEPPIHPTQVAQRSLGL